MGALRLHRRAGPPRHRLLHLHRRHGPPLRQGSGQPAAASAGRGLHRQGGQQVRGLRGRRRLHGREPQRALPVLRHHRLPHRDRPGRAARPRLRTLGPRGRPRHPLHRPQPRPLSSTAARWRRSPRGRGGSPSSARPPSSSSSGSPSSSRDGLPDPGPDGHDAARRRRPRRASASLAPRRLECSSSSWCARLLSPASDPRRPRAGPRPARRRNLAGRPPAPPTTGSTPPGPPTRTGNASSAPPTATHRRPHRALLALAFTYAGRPAFLVVAHAP